MTNNYVSFISDSAFENCVAAILARASAGRSKAINEMGRNVLDPFTALFAMVSFEIDSDEWVKSEQYRQSEKSLTNAIGDFHQSMLGQVKDWQSLPTGGQIDLVSTKHKIVAEIKNRYSTVTGGSLFSLYSGLNNIIEDKTSLYKGYTAYYVTLLAKSPVRFNKPFTPSDKSKGKQVAPNDKVRIIDGSSFYELVTGRPNAIQEVFQALPKVVEKVSSKKLNKEYDFALNLFNQAFSVTQP